MITIDPPPPVEAAGSSLLYSKEFYAIIRRRLRPGGILQQWLPGGDAVVHASVARALKESFPYVRVFHSVQDWGYHFLASDQPLPNRTAAELAARLPASAARDFVEWGPGGDPGTSVRQHPQREFPLDQMIAEAPQAPALDDDRPQNEYNAIRRHRAEPKQRGIVLSITEREARLQSCHRLAPEALVNKNGPRTLQYAGRPVDCLGLTKGWSLYVAPSVNSGSRRKLPSPGGSNPKSPVVVRWFLEQPP